jgi:kinesin family protein 2/24
MDYFQTNEDIKSKNIYIEKLINDVDTSDYGIKAQKYVKNWRKETKSITLKDNYDNNNSYDEIQNINVCVGLRPLLPYEELELGNRIYGKAQSMGNYEFEAVSLTSSHVFIHTEDRKHGQLLENFSMSTKKYQVHKTIDENISIPLNIVPSLINTSYNCGGSANCLAYGQTNAGKTFTITQILEVLGLELIKLQNIENKFKIILSFCELRGEKCYDIFSSFNDDKKDDKEIKLNQSIFNNIESNFDNNHLKNIKSINNPIPIRENENKIHMIGLTEIEIKGLSHYYELLTFGLDTRQQASTLKNYSSSRSHIIVTFKIEFKDSLDININRNGSIRIIDLAGSERYEDSLIHNKDRIEEMKGINFSLSCLKDCLRSQIIYSKNKKQKIHTPYRRSKLTLILKDIFDQNDDDNNKRCTYLIAHVSPMRSDMKHTLNTLDFTSSILEISRLQKDKAKLSGPATYSKEKVMNFIESLDNEESNGIYATLSEYFSITGRMLSLEWIGHIEKRVIAAGGTVENAQYIYDQFHKEIKSHKLKELNIRK